MDETINTTVMEADDWDDIDLSDVSDDTAEEEVFPGGDGTGEADPQEPEAEAGQDGATETKKQTDGQGEADQLFTLKHLDETRQVGRDEVVALAQKGMDYDRIRQDRDTARAEAARLSEMEEFLKELAAPGNMTVEELMDITRANILAEREGIDQSIALQRVKLERDRKALDAQKQSMERQNQADAQQAAEQRRIQDSMARFVQEHPGLDAKEIPSEVWEAVAAGKDMSDAYAIHEAKLLRETLAERDREIETLRQNKNNQARSTGSQTTAGSRKSSEDDEFDRLWYDGT